jgi:hypothetical protein
LSRGDGIGADPPSKGKSGYNVSKAGLKAYTEQCEWTGTFWRSADQLVAHDLRNTPGCGCSAHLFIPGWTWTGLAAAVPELRNSAASTMLPGMWTPEQTIEFMAGKIFNEHVFYAVCPDDEVTTVSGVLVHDLTTTSL